MHVAGHVCFVFKLVHVSLEILQGVELWACLFRLLPELVVEILQDCVEKSDFR